MIDATATSIPLTGLALTIFATSAVCLVLSAITVSLRFWVRLQDGALGLDDALIVAGLVRYIYQVWFHSPLPAIGRGFGRRCKYIDLCICSLSMPSMSVWHVTEPLLALEADQQISILS